MIIEAPANQELQSFLGKELFSAYEKLIAAIEARYSLEKVWHGGGKKWAYELKFRKGAKTICSLLMNENRLGFMVIFGKAERTSFEEARGVFTPKITAEYEAAKTYHDGKWVLFEAHQELFPDFMKLLLIKRKPDIKK
jgi:hypothetical protein